MRKKLGLSFGAKLLQNFPYNAEIGQKEMFRTVFI